MQTYLVTGGAGFIGSRLCTSLIKQNHKVINVDNFNDFYNPAIKKKSIEFLTDHNNYLLYEADIRDRDIINQIFESNKIDAVIHLAGMAGVRPSINDPLLYEDVNVKGTITVLECMKQNNVQQLIFGSSSSVYGESDYHIRFKEDQTLQPMLSPYAITKKTGEDYCYLYHYLHQINAVILRFFTVYGPGQRPDLAIYKFTDLINHHQPIPFYGDGTSLRDYSYIEDIIQGINQALCFLKKNKAVFEIFNLSGGRAISLKMLLSMIEKELGKRAIVNQLPMQPGDVFATNADILKAKSMLNYTPKTSIEEGIRKFVSWYLSKNAK
jgi:UDP-glucuronate 4-epimerase